MPNRAIKESIRTSENLNELSDGAETMFHRLTTVADDFGRFEADPRVLLANCYPLKVTQLSLDEIRHRYAELEASELVQTYRVGDRVYGVFLTWDTHQRRRAQHSKFPSPEESEAETPLTWDTVQDFEKRLKEEELEASENARGHLTADDGKCQQMTASGGHVQTSADIRGHMLHETRDARHETRDARHETRDAEGVSPELRPASVTRRARDPAGGKDHPGFETWWAEYPVGRKVKKPKARAAWNRHKPDPIEALEGLKRWKRSAQWRGGKIEHPATWLNGHCWNDHPDETGSRSKEEDLTDARERSFLEAAKHLVPGSAEGARLGLPGGDPAEGHAGDVLPPAFGPEPSGVEGGMSLVDPDGEVLPEGE